MANIGSVFLGDVQRLRILSTPSSPSSSPPPSSPPSSSISAVFPQISQSLEQKPMDAPGVIPPDQPPPPTIEPLLALDLRIRWLEALLHGVKHDSKGGEHDVAKTGNSLCQTAEDIQRRLDAVVNGNDGLKRFMASYDQHAHLLTPAFALSGTLPETAPTYDGMPSTQFESLLAEMEPDIRVADRDMREIELLEQKGVTGAGKLTSYEGFRPRSVELLKRHSEDIELAASLEKRMTTLMERHTTQVDALSELFVSWDDTLTDVEDKITRLERERAERIRLGFE